MNEQEVTSDGSAITYRPDGSIMVPAAIIPPLRFFRDTLEAWRAAGLDGMWAVTWDRGVVGVYASERL